MAHAGAVPGLAEMPAFPDHWAVTEEADDAHPFRLVTAPARTYLNSSFTETPGSRAREGRPEALIHPGDAARHGIAEGASILMGNTRGEVRLHARLFAGVRPGVVIVEGIWPNAAHDGGAGINTLVGSDAAAPFGGAAFHDSKIWIKAVA
jgi:anaerobic selenocysteine-containing dehydrogenase